LNKAVFFDRDGVLNELIDRDGGYYSPQNTSDFILSERARDTINKLKKLNYLSIVVSNQPDISRGKLKKTELDQMTKLLFNRLLVDDVFYCIHDDIDNCNCRKPLSGLIIKAKQKWKINLSKSYMVGDTWKDGESAKKVNLKFILLSRNYNLDYNCSDRINSLLDIIKFIGR